MEKSKEQQDLKKRLLVAKTGLNLFATKSPHQAVEHLVSMGIKLASSAFKEEFASPLKLQAELLAKYGPEFLTFKPETLFALVDRDYHNIPIGKNLEHFHETGELQTDVPPLVRNKIYAIRTVMTSDGPHVDWVLFEKVGSAFCDRLAKFDTVEPLSAPECARTVSIIDKLRPDTFNNEVCTYIGLTCHEYGLYTSAPSKYLKMADSQLQGFNGEKADPGVVATISAAMPGITGESDDMVHVQAMKLVACDAMGDNI